MVIPSAGTCTVSRARIIVRNQCQPVWMAVPTQLMADPEDHTLAGVTLLQTFMNGPQDFSVTDLAGDQTRRIRTALGDTLASLYSLYWIRPLKPFIIRRKSMDCAG